MKKHSGFCNTASRLNANMSKSSSYTSGSPMKKMKTEDKTEVKTEVKDKHFKRDLDADLEFLCKLTKTYVPDCAGMSKAAIKKSNDKDAKSA